MTTERFEMWRVNTDKATASQIKNYPDRIVGTSPNIEDYPEIGPSHEYRLYRIEEVRQWIEVRSK